MKETKKICLVIPSLQAGGMERVMSELANFFSTKSNIEVHVLAMVKSNVFYTLSPEVFFYEPPFLFNSGNRIINQVRTIIFVRQTLKKINPVSVLSFGETYNSFVLLASLGLGLKVFVSDRSKPDKEWGRFHEFLRKTLYPFAFGIISQTNYSKDFLYKETKNENIKVIPNPVDITKFTDQSKENVILFVGRLISTKRIDQLIEIFSKINNENFKLWIVGDGPLREALVKKAINLGLTDRIIFWGNQKNIELFYSKANIFAFTSVSEGFPNALLEALASGIPSVSYDCIAGPSDLIQDGYNGFLIPLEDQLAFRNKLQELIDNDDLRNRMSYNAKNSSLKYEITKIGDDYLNFLLS